MFNDPDLGYLENLKQQVIEIYEKTLNTFSYFGFNGGSQSNPSGEDLIYKKPFCQKEWKSYDLRETIYAQVPQSNFTAVLDAVWTGNGTFCVLKYASAYDPRMQREVYALEFYNSRGSFVASQTFGLPYGESLKIANLVVDNHSGFIYVYVEAKNAYLFKRQANFPFDLVKSAVVPLTNSTYGKLKLNLKTRDLYLFFYQNAFVFTSDLAFKTDMAVVSGYGDYMHNGFFWYASDGTSIYRFDERKQEITIKRFRNEKVYYSRNAIVSECVMVALGTAYNQDGGSFTVFDFFLLNGAEIYSINLDIRNAYSAAISVGSDGKIYVLNSENMSVSIIDFNRF